MMQHAQHARNAHLWRDRTFEEELTCFSDELVAEIEREGVRLPKLFQMKEVADASVNQKARLAAQEAV